MKSTWEQLIGEVFLASVERGKIGIAGKIRCAAMALALVAPVYAMADTVSGRVFGQDDKPLPNATLTAKPAKGDTVEFKTNASGNFSVFLDPGRYTVSSTGGQAMLDAYPQPVQQDVHLKKGGK